MLTTARDGNGVGGGSERGIQGHGVVVRENPMAGQSRESQ